MNDLAPWLVVGGAAAVLLCVVVTLTAVFRALRGRSHAASDVRDVRSTLRDVVADAAVEDDVLMPLLLGAALEATGADAAVVTFVREGGRRRSYSTNLEVREARGAVDTLVASGLAAGGLVAPIERAEVRGALAALWRRDAPGNARAGELEELVDAAFPPSQHLAAGPQPRDRERWSRLAVLNGTFDPAALLRRLVEAAIADCGADAAAARLAAEDVAASCGFADHERGWTESVLASQAFVPSITRYLTRSSDAGAVAEAPIGTAVVVPLRAVEDGVIGNFVAVWRRDLAGESDRNVAELESLFEDARSALGHAIQFQRLQADPGRDAATGPFDQRHFFTRLDAGVQQARAGAHPLALLAFAATEVEPVTDDVWATTFERALIEGAARIASAIEGRGATYRVALAEFVVVLPDTDQEGAERVLDALMSDLADQRADEPRLKWSAIALERADAESADELWERVRRQLRLGDSLGEPRGTFTTSGEGSTVRLSLGERGGEWIIQRRRIRDDPDA
jgi:GGDEF domain-containing protein